MIHVLAFLIAFCACSVYAYGVGGGPERAAVLAQLCALLLSIFAGFIHIPGDFATLPAGLAVADIALGIALTVLALWSNRYWPIVLAGFQVATILAHIAKSLFTPLPPSGYAILVTIWAWPMLVVTAIGALNHRRRTRRFGNEQDWKKSWR